MSLKRTDQVNVDQTAYYHCTARCVRRAYLCGDDPRTGGSFDHRRDWLVARIQSVASTYSVGVCAYAILPDHFHLIVRLDRDTALAWSDEVVAERYRKFYPASKAQLEAFTKKERAEKLALFRERMWDISWMMRTLREQLSRMANKEDGCGGRFWEGPSSSQPLLDDHGLLAAMVYVDLNPVRNRLARHPADSEGTSIERRIERHSPRRAKTARVPAGLLPMAGQAPEGAFALPFTFSEYIDVLEWTTEGLLTKRGRSQPTPSLISRLGIQPDAWLKEMAETPLKGFSALGRPEAMDVYAKYLGLQKTRGIRWSRALFGAD